MVLPLARHSAMFWIMILMCGRTGVVCYLQIPSPVAWRISLSKANELIQEEVKNTKRKGQRRPSPKVACQQFETLSLGKWWHVKSCWMPNVIKPLGGPDLSGCMFKTTNKISMKKTELATQLTIHGCGSSVIWSCFCLWLQIPNQNCDFLYFYNKLKKFPTKTGKIFQRSLRRGPQGHPSRNRVRNRLRRRTAVESWKCEIKDPWAKKRGSGHGFEMLWMFGCLGLKNVIFQNYKLYYAF